MIFFGLNLLWLIPYGEIQMEVVVTFLTNTHRSYSKDLLCKLWRQSMKKVLMGATAICLVALTPSFVLSAEYHPTKETKAHGTARQYKEESEKRQPDFEQKGSSLNDSDRLVAGVLKGEGQAPTTFYAKEDGNGNIIQYVPADPSEVAGRKGYRLLTEPSEIEKAQNFMKASQPASTKSKKYS